MSCLNVLAPANYAVLCTEKICLRAHITVTGNYINYIMSYVNIFKL